MAKDQNTRNPKPKEVVGSKDLREAFKDGNIRGSFFINGIEMHQFEANSPSSVVSQINSKTSGHFVHAEIDDGGHLVLIDKSGADIRIRQGAAYVAAGPASTGDVAKDVLQNLKHESEKQRKEGDGNNILEALGLEETDKAVADDNSAARPGFETGRSAEDREKAWKDQQAGAPQQNGDRQPSVTGQVDKRGAPQIPSNPTPGTNGPDGKLEDGRGRTGTGGGSGESSGPGIGHRGQPANSPGSAL